MLAKRLSQRGIVFSGSVVALSAGSASASAPPALVASTIKAASLLAAGRAAGVISAKVAALTEGVVKAMFVTKIKGVLAVVLVIATLAGAAGLLCQTQAADQPKAKEEQPAAKQDQKKGEEKQAVTKGEKSADGPRSLADTTWKRTRLFNGKGTGATASRYLGIDFGKDGTGTLGCDEKIKWSQNGRKITIVFDADFPPNRYTKTFVVSEDGKSFTAEEDKETWEIITPP